MWRRIIWLVMAPGLVACHKERRVAPAAPVEPSAVPAVASSQGLEVPTVPESEPPVSEAPVVQVALGPAYTCALHGDGAVSCWGDAGWLVSPGERQKWLRPARLRGVENAVEILVAPNTACVRLRDGTVVCWSKKGHAERQVRPELAAELKGAIQFGGVCAIGADHQVRCLDREDHLLTVDGLGDAVQVDSNGERGCAVRAGGQVLCWDILREFDLDAPPGPAKKLKTKLMTLGASEVKVASSACARLRTGRVSCWGHNGYGELGRLTPDPGEEVWKQLPPPFPPGLVEGVSEVVELSLGDSVACAKNKAGAWLCWGEWPEGTSQWKARGVQESLNTPASARRPRSSPERQRQGFRPRPILPELAQASALEFGGEHQCARMGGREVRCWGQNQYGQLGLGHELVQARPQRVPGVTEAIQVVAESERSCARRRDGSVVCWGDGDATVTPVEALRGAVQIADHVWPCSRDEAGRVSCLEHGVVKTVALEEAAVEVSVSTMHGCAVLAGGSVRCWGRNEYGASGNGTREPQHGQPAGTHPAFLGVDDAVHLANAPFTVCVLRRSGDVVCAGDDMADHVLENGENLTPTQVVGLSHVKQLAGEAGQMCALTEGRVACWGHQKSTFGEPTTPLQLTYVPELNDAVQVSVGDGSSCARRQSGKLVCWGSNRWVQLGLRTWGQESEPLATRPSEVPDLHEVVDVSVGKRHVCAVVSDGSVACWGSTLRGQCGTLATGMFRTPTAVRWP